jgi:hypothetical protein
MSLTEPIVKGAYYEREDGSIGRATILYGFAHVCGDAYKLDGARVFARPRLIRRVYIVPTDPAELVAELRRRADAVLADNTEETDELIEETWTAEEDAIRSAADLVAEKLGVGNG